MSTYLSLCAEFYDTDKPTAPADELAYYVAFASEANGPLFEPMCGSGRFLVPLLEAGYEVDGADASPTMLGACRQKAAERGFLPKLYGGSLAELDLPARYALMFIPTCSFCLIADLTELRASLEALRQGLRPGGKLVFEFERRSAGPRDVPLPGYKTVTRADGKTIVLTWIKRIDDEGVVRSIDRYELIDGGTPIRSEVEMGSYRTHEPSELESLLSRVGFGSFRYWKARQRGEPDPSDDLLTLECVKE